MNLKQYGHDMEAYTPSEIVEVTADSTEELEFQGPSSSAPFGITRLNLSAETPRELKVTFETASGDTTHWRDVLARAIQKYFDGHALSIPLLIPRSEKALVTLEDTSGSPQTVGVQLEGLHDNALTERQETLGLSEEHKDLSFFHGTATVADGASLDDLGVNYERRRARAFDRFALAATADAPHDLRARLVEANSPVRRLATFDQIDRAFAQGRRAPTPYKTEPYGSFSVEVTNQDTSAHEVSFFAASVPPSHYDSE